MAIVGMTKGVKTIAAAVLVLAGWTGISAVLALAMPAGRSVAVIGPHGMQAVVAAGGSPLRADRMMVIARSEDPDFVRRLYAAGAVLVLDAEDAGACSGRALAGRPSPAGRS